MSPRIMFTYTGTYHLQAGSNCILDKLVCSGYIAFYAVNINAPTFRWGEILTSRPMFTENGPYHLQYGSACPLDKLVCFFNINCVMLSK